MDSLITDVVPRMIKEDIISILNHIIPQNKLACCSNDVDLFKLKELGLDSLTYVELVVEIEQKYDFEFEDDMLVLDALNGFNDLVMYIFSKKPTFYWCDKFVL